ncbi:hypothetical protein OHA98_39855 [Streptomyces sp. NBC_00654]|uniref:hypothetical protein n=1 Tax=Streptomyces sp. NBC_00654 TaxID=2975799 RepID=UPI00224F0A91|nr:hypothetical protein [Streptomyces sp. NBC_00654]MCX4970798.1 hypothetical protein [Streptomyces sp. NBC_00654]
MSDQDRPDPPIVIMSDETTALSSPPSPLGRPGVRALLDEVVRHGRNPRVPRPNPQRSYWQHPADATFDTASGNA